MKIRKTLSSVLLLFALCLITACSGNDAPPAITSTAPAVTPTAATDTGPDQSVFVGTCVTLNDVKGFCA